MIYVSCFLLGIAIGAVITSLDRYFRHRAQVARGMEIVRQHMKDHA